MTSFNYIFEKLVWSQLLNVDYMRRDTLTKQCIIAELISDFSRPRRLYIRRFAYYRPYRKYRKSYSVYDAWDVLNKETILYAGRVNLISSEKWKVYFL